MMRHLENHQIQIVHIEQGVCDRNPAVIIKSLIPLLIGSCILRQLVALTSLIPVVVPSSSLTFSLLFAEKYSACLATFTCISVGKESGT